MSSVNLVNAAGLAAQSSRLLAGADAETILYAQEIRDSHSRVNDIMQQLNNARTLRETIANRLQMLQLLDAATTAAKDKDGNLPSLRDLDQQIDKVAGGDQKLAQELKALARKGGGWTASINSQTGQLETSYPTTQVQVTGRCSMKSSYGEDVTTEATWYEDRERGTPLVTVGASAHPVQADIKKLENDLSKLDGDRQLLMVQVNQEIDNKNKVVQLLTNMLKAKNDAAKMILSNLRPG